MVLRHVQVVMTVKATQESMVMMSKDLAFLVLLKDSEFLELTWPLSLHELLLLPVLFQTK